MGGRKSFLKKMCEENIASENRRLIHQTWSRGKAPKNVRFYK